MDSPGITVRPIDTIGGDHDLNEVFFDNVHVPLSNLVGAENRGRDCAKYLLEFERGAGIFSPRLRSQLKRIGDTVKNQENRATRSPEFAQVFGEVVADLDTFEMLELKVMGGLPPGGSPGALYLC